MVKAVAMPPFYGENSQVLQIDRLFAGQNGIFFTKTALKSIIQLDSVSKISKAHFHCLTLHIFVEKPHRSSTAPALFVSICKSIQQNCIFQTLETHSNGDSPDHDTKGTKI